MLHQAAISVSLLFAFASFAFAGEDWTQFRHDVRRSGRTTESLAWAELKLAWSWASPQPPQPAWHGPAKWDAYANLRGLKSMRNYDPVFHPVAVGDAVYFASSADDSVHCLDARTGATRWTFTTDGPVRVAPTYDASSKRLYFGSDDGHAYCISAASGKLVWKFKPPAAKSRQLLHNGRLIPLHPIRTGVLVDGKRAYFAASMLPWETSYLGCVDADTGQVDGAGTFLHEIESLTMEGPLALTPRMLVVPQGRVPPQLFDRQSGKNLGSLSGGGGSLVVVTDEDRLLHGPGNKAGWITSSDAESRAQIASFPGGNAIVVAGKIAYILTDDKLTATNLETKKVEWQIPCSQPYELILAGETLLAGGVDEVAAYSIKDGQPVARFPVAGKVYGLAVAQGSLLVSTDTGQVCCFRVDGEATAEPTPAPGVEPAQTPKFAGAAYKPTAIKDPALLQHYVFHLGQTTAGADSFQGRVADGAKIENLAADQPPTNRQAQFAGNFTIRRFGPVQALEMTGEKRIVRLADRIDQATLPTEAMTAVAWVRIDQPQEWGAVIGCVQDNGSYEHGWLLGYRNDKFAFAIHGKQGPNRLTYLTAKESFAPGQWHQVVGVYDGQTQRVYVDGQLAAESEEQRGPISYPPRAVYEIGAYHDDNEFYPCQGMLHEIRVYRRALTAAEITADFKQTQKLFPAAFEPAVGPWLTFTGPSTAEVRYRTTDACPSQLTLELDGATHVIGSDQPTRDHRIELTGLKRDRVYRYTLQIMQEGQVGVTPSYECDTFFNYEPAPLPEVDLPGEVRERAGELRADAASDGLVAMLGPADPQLGVALASGTRLRVVLFDTDGDRVAAAREWLLRERCYGRVVVQHVAELSQIPVVGRWANLTVVSPKLHAKGVDGKQLAEALRITRPEGGVLAVDARGLPADLRVDLAPAIQAAEVECPVEIVEKAGMVRGRLGAMPGAGVWSHLYGDADNSAFGGEALAGARQRSDLEIHWLGRPGPRYQPDRSGRKPSPLATDGRLFLQGLHRMIALDGFNGTVLWSLELPHFERFNVPRDASNWCADEEYIYAAMRGRLWQIRAATGEVVRQTPVVSAERRPDESADWGYVAVRGDRVLGTAVPRDTSWTDYWGGFGWYDAKAGPATFKVCADNLFALDRDSGEKLWTYEQGLIIHPTLTVDASRVYFIESRNQEAIAARGRRFGAEIDKEQFLVCLDLSTGEKKWEQRLKIASGEVALYLAHRDGRLVAVASSGRQYHVYAFDDAKGEMQWQQHVRWPSDNHGGHMSRPAIVGDALYVRPHSFDVATGKLRKQGMPMGGCGTYACTEGALFFRSSTVTMFDREAGKVSQWKRLRPDCWLSTIPASGMLLSPEGGGGCSCGSWMETSLGFMPKREVRTAWRNRGDND